MNADTSLSPRGSMPYRNTKLSISVGVRGTEVLATTLKAIRVDKVLLSGSLVKILPFMTFNQVSMRTLQN